MNNAKSEIQQCRNYFIENDTDVIFYVGDVSREGYLKFCSAIPENKKKNLVLVLVTFGGDANAGYRIARAAIHHYSSENFRVLIPSYCKSAGTLICIGAKTLVMADQAELGPLDVQLKKTDEMFQNNSGLDILRGIAYLQKEALESFKGYLYDINVDSGLSTKIASDISSKLVIGLYEPLLAQIDPLKLGEMNAALQIAYEYGTRLDDKSKSLQPNALNKLINNYPSHGFVIDRAEARTLFNSVEKPTQAEAVLVKCATRIPYDKVVVLDFIASIKLQTPSEPQNEPNELTRDDETSEPSKTPDDASNPRPEDTNAESQDNSISEQPFISG